MLLMSTSLLTLRTGAAIVEAPREGRWNGSGRPATRRRGLGDVRASTCRTGCAKWVGLQVCSRRGLHGAGSGALATTMRKAQV
jgi:hypothetical protein